MRSPSSVPYDQRPEVPKLAQWRDDAFPYVTNKKESTASCIDWGRGRPSIRSSVGLILLQSVGAFRQNPIGVAAPDVQTCRLLKYDCTFYALAARCYEVVTHFDQKWKLLQAEFRNKTTSGVLKANGQSERRETFLTVCITQLNTSTAISSHVLIPRKEKELKVS